MTHPQTIAPHLREIGRGRDGALAAERSIGDALAGYGPVPGPVDVQCPCIVLAIAERGSGVPADATAQ